MSDAHNHEHKNTDIKRIENYEPYSHLLPTTDLTFDLKSQIVADPESETGKKELFDVTVSSKLHFAPNPESKGGDGSLVLNGAPATRPKGDAKPTLDLVSIKIDGRELDESEYVRKGEELKILNAPEGEFDVEVVTSLDPTKNKENQGLYLAGDKLLTQCESTGFRNITFYPDRPDVLSQYTTTIVGDDERFNGKVYDKNDQVIDTVIGMVSNGDVTNTEIRADGRTAVTYFDETPKNSYLFALGAGEFDVLRDQYTIGGWREEGAENPIPNSRAGKVVDLEVYVEPGKFDQGRHSMESLKKVMELDERMFDREYDIDTYRMAATDVFNFGAMENKGFNIFNSTAMLASPDVATDTSYQRVFDVVAHEYAHNWSGNIVTVKDWFEVTLKEGFTNFREKAFSGEVTDHDVKRIEDVADLRGRQFAEDASPNAKPIRPTSYSSIDNMYGPTIYDKGAEVIRMMQTLVGDDAFKEGLNYYFEENKGKAVRSDDFVAAIEHASGVDLAQFKDTWYNQAGTPEVAIKGEYDPEAKTYTMTVKQEKPKVNVANFPKDDPYHIPIKMGLLDSEGNDIPLEIEGDDGTLLTNKGEVLNLRESEQTFVFKNVPEEPLPSLFRGFSAPVRLDYDYSRDDLQFMLNNDNDSFNRWEAGNQMAVAILMEQVDAAKAGETLAVDDRLIETYRNVLTDDSIESSLKSELVALPSSSYLSGLMEEGEVDWQAIKDAYDTVKQTIAVELESELTELYQENTSAIGREYEFNGADVAEREIRHTALRYLMEHPENEEYVGWAKAEFDAQENKTDVVAGLTGVINNGTEEQRKEVVDAYYEKWKDEPLNMYTWLSAQAYADRDDVFETVKELTEHPAYDKTNPNLVRQLLGAFGGNKVHFHREDGAAYEFLADKVLEADTINGKMSSGIVGALLDVKKYDEGRQEKMQAQLERISAQPNITSNLRELVDNVLREIDPEALDRITEEREAASNGRPIAGEATKRLARRDSQSEQQQGQAM